MEPSSQTSAHEEFPDLPAQRVNKLLEALENIQRDEALFLFLGCHAMKSRVTSAVERIACSSADEADWFRTGTYQKSASYPSTSKSRAEIVMRAIESLAVPPKERSRKLDAIPGLLIESIEFKTPTGATAGYYTLLVKYEDDAPVTLGRVEADVLGNWRKFRTFALARGIVLPDENGYSAAWNTALMMSRSKVTRGAVDASESTQGAIVLRIQRALASDSASDDIADVGNGKVYIERGKNDELRSYMIGVDSLVCQVSRALTGEQVTRPMVADAAKFLGGRIVRLNRSNMAARPRVWIFPPEVLTDIGGTDDDQVSRADSCLGPHGGVAECSGPDALAGAPGNGEDDRHRD